MQEVKQSLAYANCISKCDRWQWNEDETTNESDFILYTVIQL